jgi:prepilin-type processing-associated H-X9-DG protein
MSQVFDFGAWLPSPAYGGSWRTYAKMQEIVNPVKTFVFIDENPDSINDAAFATQCNGSVAGTGSPAIADIPASYHNKAGGLSFADGHSEVHRWHGSNILNFSGTFSPPYPAWNRGDLDDFMYLALNSTARY